MFQLAPSCDDLTNKLPHVDLAGDGGGDEGRAAFLEQLDGSFGFPLKLQKRLHPFVYIIGNLLLFIPQRNNYLDSPYKLNVHVHLSCFVADIANMRVCKDKERVQKVV